jgi:hypothetical protein
MDETFQSAPVTSAPSSSQGSNNHNKRLATLLAVIMAIVGSSILISYGRSAQLASSNADLVRGVTSANQPLMTSGRPLMNGAKPMRQSQDGVGNVIFDYETISAEDYAADGETVVECLQVRAMSLSLSWLFCFVGNHIFFE